MNNIWLTWYYTEPALFNKIEEIIFKSALLTSNNKIKFKNIFKILPIRINDNELVMRKTYKDYFPLHVLCSKKLVLKSETKESAIKSALLTINLWNSGFMAFRLQLSDLSKISKTHRWVQDKWRFQTTLKTLPEIISVTVIDFLKTLDLKSSFKKNFFIKNEPNLFLVKYDSYGENFTHQEQYVKKTVYTKNNTLKPGFEKINLDYDNQFELFLNIQYGKIVFRQERNCSLNKQVRDGIFYTIDAFYHNLFFLKELANNTATLLNSSQTEVFIQFIATNLYPDFFMDNNGPLAIHPYYEILTSSKMVELYQEAYNNFADQCIAKFDQLNEFSKSLFYQHLTSFSKGLLHDFLLYPTKKNALEGYMDIKDNALLSFSFAVAVEAYKESQSPEYSPLVDDIVKKKQISTHTIVIKSLELRNLSKEELDFPYDTLKTTLIFSKDKIYREDPLGELYRRNVLSIVKKGRGRPRKQSEIGNVQFVLSEQWQDMTKIHSFFD